MNSAKCPKCGSEITEIQQRQNEIEATFSADGKGKGFTESICPDCGKVYALYFNFEYKITGMRAKK